MLTYRMHMVFTDLAVIEVATSGLLLKEVSPGLSAADGHSVTELELIFAPDLKEIGITSK